VRAGSGGFSQEAQQLTVTVVVRARFGDQSQTIPATPGASVRQLLEDTDLRVRTAATATVHVVCAGSASCRAGVDSDIGGEAESRPALIEAGCALRARWCLWARGDRVMDLAPRSAWRPIAPRCFAARAPDITAASGPARISRIAIDVGTTNLASHSGRRSRGRLAARRG